MNFEPWKPWSIAVGTVIELEVCGVKFHHVLAYGYREPRNIAEAVIAITTDAIIESMMRA